MANRLDQLIDAFEPVLRRAFLDSIFNIRDRAQLDQIVRMLEAGNVDGAIRAVGLDPVAFRPFDKAITQAFEAGGDFTSKALPVVRDAAGFKAVFEFGIRNPEAEAFLRERSTGMVREILDDQRNMIRSFLTDGLSKGVNPRTSALDLVGRIATSGKREGGVIGLTSSQEQWVRNYAQELADDPAAALKRGLRDKRFDRTVAKAIRTEAAIPADMQAKMVRNYKNNSLRYKAETIARSETIAALHESQDQAMRQAMSTGAIRHEAVVGIWRTAKPRDRRARESHTPMDGQIAQFGMPFTTGNGNRIMFPGDRSAPVEETANCRCWRELRVDFLAGVN